MPAHDPTHELEKPMQGDNTKFQELDPQSCPLSGTVLVEASAGTGKTYALSKIFLRLLLEKGLHVSQILVVTFTNAATEELKYRIRQRLREALNSFGEAGREIVREAIRDFDQASIYTIHGFCQRLLYENAFETGQAFDLELLPSEEELYQEVSLDFYRQRFHQVPEELWGVVGDKVTPDDLANLLQHQYRHPELQVIPPGPSPWGSEVEKLRAWFRRLKEIWPLYREEVAQILLGWSLDGNAYGKDGSLNRERRVGEYLAQMDQFLWLPWPKLPLPDCIQRLSWSFLVDKTNKGGTPKPHEVFDLCQKLWEHGERLKEKSEQYARAWMAEFMAEAPARVEQLKERWRARTFSDLILAVERALRGEGGELLRASVSSQYKAALIDEFQDTDSLQYRIFKALFGTEERPLFLIGDPKQSIYGFRGAELFTYLKVAREVKTRFTLTKNYRSHQKMVQAVNRLFTLRPDPFVFKEIQFAPGTAAESGEDKELILNGSPSPALKLWILGEGHTNKTELKKVIARSVAREIRQLITLGARGHALIGGDKLRSGDLAVLVRANWEALLIQEALRELGVHSVIYSGESVWQTQEAEELERLLWAVSAPQEEGLVRGALATTVLGRTATELYRLSQDEEAWEETISRFSHYNQLWQEKGPAVMLRTLMKNEGVKGRLLSLPDGERRLTNLVHLMELLHEEWSQVRGGMMGLLRWMGEQRRRKGAGAEETLLRLESDEEAVKVLTVHKSKGLEFPIVFCPFAWDVSESNKKNLILFHPRKDETICLDLGSDDIEQHETIYQREVLGEEARLLYVAVTRAKSCCYLVFCPEKCSGLSGLTHIFSWLYSSKDTVPGFQEFKGMIEEALKGPEVEVGLPFHKEGIETPPPPSRLPGELGCRHFSSEIPRDWRITSFSALASHRESAPELPDYDALLGEEEPLEAGDEAVREKKSFLDFPRGPRAGVFIHKVLEELDFTLNSMDAMGALVAEKLKAFGFGPEWTGPVCQMLQKLLSLSLDPAHPELTLSRIPMESRLNELEFLFPLKKINPQELMSVLELKGQDAIQTENLTFSPVRGFMKGFIDLVFTWKGRFYLVDWKSNYLGPSPEDYNPAAIRRVMASESYVLQYHIYSLALHQYLRQRIPDYDYCTHFGGIYYVFLRGIHWGPEQGIFRDRPREELMEELVRLLLDRAGVGNA